MHYHSPFLPFQTSYSTPPAFCTFSHCPPLTPSHAPLPLHSPCPLSPSPTSLAKTWRVYLVQNSFSLMLWGTFCGARGQA